MDRKKCRHFFLSSLTCHLAMDSTWWPKGQWTERERERQAARKRSAAIALKKLQFAPRVEEKNRKKVKAKNASDLLHRLDDRQYDRLARLHRSDDRLHCRLARPVKQFNYPAEQVETVLSVASQKASNSSSMNRHLLIRFSFRGHRASLLFQRKLHPQKITFCAKKHHCATSSPATPA